MSVCAYIKPNGERCKAQAPEGTQWCWNHDPSYGEQRKANARKGGKKAGRGRPLTELRALRAENGQLREQMLKGELRPGVLAVAVQSINVDIRCLEVELKAREQEDLEGRIEELETVLEQRQERYYGT
jgi:hypothetical protein